MRYKEVTLQKYEKAMRAAVNELTLQAEKLELRVSNGDKKIGRVKNVSTAPILTCGNCQNCKPYCYDIKACLFRPTVMNARAVNTALYYTDPDGFFEQCKKKMSKRCKHKYWRWQQGGEIVDDYYFEKMNETLLERPDWFSWFYTKMYEIVNSYIARGGLIPSNLQPMFSADKNAVVPNPYGIPIFYTVIPGDTPPKGYYKCPGNCDICKKIHRGCIAGENTYTDEH